MKNKHVKRVHASERKFQQIVRLFSAGLNASRIAELTSLNRNKINRYLSKIRQCLVEYCDVQSPFAKEVSLSRALVLDTLLMAVWRRHPQVRL